MSYGIEIKSSDDRVQIAQDFSNMFVNSTGNASRGAAYPPTGFSAGDMVACRATSTGYAAVAYDDVTDNRYEFGDTRTSTTHYDDAAAFQFKILRPFAGNVSANSAGDYGIEVFTSSGDVVYSTSKENFVRIATLGTASGDSVVRYPASGTIDLSKHFALFGNALGHLYVEITFFIEFFGNITQTFEYMQGYQYNYTSGNNGYINITNEARFDGVKQNSSVVGDFDYCIFELVD